MKITLNQDPPDEEELEGDDRGEGEDEGAGAGGGRGVRLPVRWNLGDTLRRPFQRGLDLLPLQERGLMPQMKCECKKIQIQIQIQRQKRGLMPQMKCECECRGAELEEAKQRCQGREGVSFWDER